MYPSRIVMICAVLPGNTAPTYVGRGIGSYEPKDDRVIEEAQKVAKALNLPYVPSEDFPGNLPAFVTVANTKVRRVTR